MKSLDDFNDNQETADDRKGKIGQDDVQVDKDKIESSLRDQIPEKLREILEERDIGTEIVEKWNAGNALREDQLDRQRKLLIEIDEFVDPIYAKPQEWMSDLHIPMAFIICKAFHARMFAAIMGGDPPFQVKAQKEANSERSEVVQDLMNYSVKRWANNYKGIEDAVDEWLWAWVTTGRGIIKQRWHKEFTRFVDVEEFSVEGPGQVIEGQFVPTIDTRESPVKKDEVIFEGPMFDHVTDEDILIIGGNGDPDKADFVCQQLRLTPHDMWSLVDQKVFHKGTVEEIISDSTGDMASTEPVNQIKNQRAERAGEGGNADDQELIDRYQVLEAYLKVDLDGSGIASDVIVWVHAQSRKIVRATYLWRVMKTGMKPFAVIDFHKRRGQQSGVGLIELIYPLSKEMDAMHNMKIDFGLISTIPIGFYRASSSLSKERLPLTPGNLIPLDDPIRDINFPNMGNRTAFAAGEEQALFSIISRVTGLSDINFGSMGQQGAARTATGARAIINESNANLDIFLRRANRGFKKMLVYLFQMLKENMPDGLEFRITGSDGGDYFRQILSREELSGMYDFDIEPNSANSNKQVQVDMASQAMQLTQNPLLLQIGIVTPANVFEAAKNYLQTLGMRDWSRFITPPQQGSRVFTPEELANRILSGQDVVLTPDQDIQGFIAFAQEFLKKDELLGQISEQQAIALANKFQEAQQLMQAMQQMQAQQANASQVQQNAALSTQTATGGGGQAPKTGEGGEQ